MATGMVDKIKEKLILRRFSHAFSGSIAANAVSRLLPSEAGYTIPTGYYPVGITYFSTGHQSLVLDYLNLQYNSDQSTYYFIAVKNVTSSAVSSASFTVDVLFAPEWMVKQISADEPASQSGDIMNEPVFKIKQFTGEFSDLASNGGKSFTRTDLGFFVPEGYEIFSLMCISSGGMRVSISNCDPFSPNQIIKIRNTYTSAQSGTARLGVVFINRKFMLPDPRKGLIIWFNKPTMKNDTGITYDDSKTKFYLEGHASGANTVIEVNSGDQIFPQGTIISPNTLHFYLKFSTTDGEHKHIWYPIKQEVINGSEYVSTRSSEPIPGIFFITEDWTDKQIVLKFTFD